MKGTARFFTAAIVLVALVGLFYMEENWRGERDWKRCQAEFAARGFTTEWEQLIPPPVPDDQNVFKAPKMTDWFVKRAGAYTNELTVRLTDPQTTGAVGSATNAIISQTEAKEYLAWSDQFRPDFSVMREALKRPYVRVNADYSDPYQMRIENFIAIRIVAQTLAQRAHCHLVLDQPAEALADITLLYDLRRLLRPEPTGKPVLLVPAMIDVAVMGLYVETVSSGTTRHAWRESQLVSLQVQLKDINLTSLVAEALHEEPVASCSFLEKHFLQVDHSVTVPLPSGSYSYYKVMPRGWLYENLVTTMMLEHKPLAGFDLTNDVIKPEVFDASARDIDHFFDRMSPSTIVAAIAVPNYVKGEIVSAYTQTKVNEARVVCGLERYRLVHGDYPEMLEALVPQFIERLPHDIVGGQPLRYRRSSDGKFLLYSVGWNQIDDNGISFGTTTNGLPDYRTGDWIWKN